MPFEKCPECQETNYAEDCVSEHSIAVLKKHGTRVHRFR